MYHTASCRRDSTKVLNRPIRMLILTLTGSLCLTTTASVFAAHNQSLAVAAIRAFDRNHNQRLDTSEFRSLRIRMRDLFDGDSVPSTVILRAAPEYRAIYSAADRDRSVSLTSSESQAAAAVLSALSPAGDRRFSRRSSHARSSRELRPSNTRSIGLGVMSRQAGTALTVRGTSNGTRHTSASSRSIPVASVRNDLQARYRAAQEQFEAMRARMRLEAELRRRGIEVSDDVQNPQSQPSRHSNRDDSLLRNDSKEGNDGSRSGEAGSRSNDDSTSRFEDHSDDDGESDHHRATSVDDSGVSATDRSSGNSGSVGGSSGSGSTGSGTSGVSGHHEEHEGHGEGHHEEHGKHHEDHDDDGDD